MIAVGAFEAKTKFSELLERGEEIVVTRHGKTVARIVPEGLPDAEAERKARAAKADEILAEIKRVREMLRAEGVHFNYEDIVSARDEGRR